ncbi:MAG: TauD/TfdA family dioxygenase [Dinghuibacter sp.]|nr:TauD/TfdA family dioxygenase [Dinghuibacter sp.]
MAMNGTLTPAETAGTPYKVEWPAGTPINTFTEWYVQHEATIQEKLHIHGALLFRNTGINDINDFNGLLKQITRSLKTYTDGFSPRTKLQSNIYTSTEYDADYYITLHNELSYSANWPGKLFFCCIIPSETGGETPIADCRAILKAMRPELLQRFRQKGVRYIRNVHSGDGAGPSWQQTFETENKEEVENFCRANDIGFSWRNDGMLQLVQNRPAVITHPVTGEEVWFNQVDQFHPCHLPADIYETLMMLYDNDPERLPMYGCYGDGSAIDEADIQEVRALVDSKRIFNTWQKGDLLLADNILVAHGRMPYTGNRKILVAME